MARSWRLSVAESVRCLGLALYACCTSEEEKRKMSVPLAAADTAVGLSQDSSHTPATAAATPPPPSTISSARWNRWRKLQPSNTELPQPHSGFSTQELEGTWVQEGGGADSLQPAPPSPPHAVGSRAVFPFPHVRRCLAGLVYDSGPVDFTSTAGLRCACTALVRLQSRAVQPLAER